MSTTPKPLTDQIQEILAKYRNIDLKASPADVKENKDELAKKIMESNLPLYHKEAMMAILFSPTVSEMMISLEIVRQQEKSRHASSMMAIEQRLLQERLQKTSG
jgi:hypothetical protein